MIKWKKLSYQKTVYYLSGIENIAEYAVGVAGVLQKYFPNMRVSDEKNRSDFYTSDVFEALLKDPEKGEEKIDFHGMLLSEVLKITKSGKVKEYHPSEPSKSYIDGTKKLSDTSKDIIFIQVDLNNKAEVRIGKFQKRKLRNLGMKPTYIRLTLWPKNDKNKTLSDTIPMDIAENA